LGAEELLDLGRLDALEPCDRERNGTRDMAAAGFAAEAPAVVGSDRTDVDDGDRRIGNASAELLGRDGARGRCFMKLDSELRSCGHCDVPFEIDCGGGWIISRRQKKEQAL